MSKTASMPHITIVLLALFSAAAQANVFELRAVYPEEETVYLDATGGVEVPLQIRMKALGSSGIGTPYCDAVIDFGDRAPPQTVRLGESGQPQARIVHRYSTPGSYAIRMRGATGRVPCEGSIGGQLTVREASERPAASATPPVNAQAIAAAGPGITLEMRPTSSLNACPEGWFLVPGSMQGGRFTCHLAPIKPFACPNGTQFFDNGNTVGCR